MKNTKSTVNQDEQFSEHKNRLGFMVFNVTFNNISVISCWSVLFVEETEVPGESHQSLTSH